MPDLKEDPLISLPNLIDHKPNHLITTKLNTPAVLAKTLIRPRLFDCLDLSQGRKLTLICAPAGFGKTTLIVDWLKTLSLPRSWWIIDKQDNQRNQFILYLIAALRNLNPDIGKSMDVDAIRNQDIFTIMTVLINDISCMDGQGLLVLENFHFITLPEIRQFINSFIDFLPPQIHLVILTRDDGALSLGRLRIQNQIAEIRADDLRFSLDEIEQLMGLNFQRNFSPSDLREIESKTSGWAAALRMVLIYLKNTMPDPFSLQGFTSQHWFVYDFLSQEVWDGLNTEMQMFLLACSVLDQLSPDLCQTVSGYQNSFQFLSELHRNDLFIHTLDLHRYWYRIQPLFLDFLKRKLDPCQEAEYHRRASDWFESNGFYTDALNHALHAGDFEQFMRLVNKYSISLLEFGRVSEQIEQFNVLTKHGISERPWLCITYAWVLILNGDVEKADELLAHAEKTLQISEVCQSNPDLYPQLLFLQAYRMCISGDYERSKELLLKAGEFLPSSSLSIKSLFARLGGLVYLKTGEFESAVKNLKEGFRHLSIMDDYPSMGVISYYLMLVKFQQGDFQNVERSLSRLIQYPQSSDIKKTNNVFLPGHAYTKLGFIHWELSQNESARRYIFQGLQHSEQNGNMYDRIMTLLDAIRIFDLLGEKIMVKSLLEKAFYLSQSFSPYLLYLTKLAQIAHLLSLGEVQTATLKWEKLANAKPKRVIKDYERIYEGIILAKIKIAQQMFAQADGLLGELLIICQTFGAKYDEFMVLLLLTQSAYLQQKRDSACQYLKRAVVVGFENGYTASYFSIAHIADLLEDVTCVVPDSMKNYLLKIRAVKQHIFPARMDPATVQVVTPEQRDSLSDRELEIFYLIHAGCSNQQISEELNITLGTTKWHIVNIFSKLGVHSRTQAVQKGYELGILAKTNEEKAV